MTTREELKAKYRNEVIPRVAQYNFDHGTDIKPWECVRAKQICNGAIKEMTSHPNFKKWDEDQYWNLDLALTIVDDKPVFEGDVLYFKCNGSVQYTVLAGGYSIRDSYVDGYEWSDENAKHWSWTAPPAKKRTFAVEFSEEELECTTIAVRHFAGVNTKYLDSVEQKLTEARDKEQS